MNRARHHFLASAALAGDQDRDVGILHAIEQSVHSPHRRARTHEPLVAEVAVQRFTSVTQLLPRAFELLGPPVEQLAQPGLRFGELEVARRELLGALAIFAQKPGVFERDGGLVRERA